MGKHTAAVQTVLREMGQAPGERWFLERFVLLITPPAAGWTAVARGSPEAVLQELNIRGKLIHPTNMQGLYQL